MYKVAAIKLCTYTCKLDCQSGNQLSRWADSLMVSVILTSFILLQRIMTWLGRSFGPLQGYEHIAAWPSLYVFSFTVSCEVYKYTIQYIALLVCCHAACLTESKCCDLSEFSVSVTLSNLIFSVQFFHIVNNFINSLCNMWCNKQSWTLV